LLSGGAHRDQQCGSEHPFPSTHDSVLQFLSNDVPYSPDQVFPDQVSGNQNSFKLNFANSERQYAN
jgi:hypothetical protein